MKKYIKLIKTNKTAQKIVVTAILITIIAGTVLFGTAVSYVSNTVTSVEEYCNDVIADTLEQM